MARRTKCSRPEPKRAGAACCITVYFANVGQGDCTLVIGEADSLAVVVDCTCFREALGILESAGWPDLSLMVSHWHEDHVSGVGHLLRNYKGRVRALYYNDFARLDNKSGTVGASQVHGATLFAMIDAARKRKAQLVPSLRRGDSLFTAHDTNVAVLYPDPAELGDAIARQNMNDASAVTEIRCGDVVVLVGADLPPQRWLDLVGAGRLPRANVVKVPHHGARCPEGFVESLAAALRPDLAVVSVGSGNKYKHPDADCLRLWASSCRILCTQVTERCCPTGLPARDQVMALLKSVRYQASARGCPCAGTVVIRTDGREYSVLPDEDEHRAVISLMAAPQCHV